jgi:hypothetical protein
VNWHATSGSTPTTSSLYASSILRLKVVLVRLILRNARTQDTIRLAARHFGIQHRESYVTPDDLVRSIPAVAADYDQPFGNSSVLPAYYCAKMAREEGVTKVLKLHDNLLVGGSGPMLATPARPGDEVRDNRRVDRSAFANDLSPAGTSTGPAAKTPR